MTPGGWYDSLRKNLGKKNCEFAEGHIRKICDLLLSFKETEQSKIFPNEAFGYWKIVVERPLRFKGIDPNREYNAKEIKEMVTKGLADENGVPAIKKIHNPGKTSANPFYGLFEIEIDGKKCVVEYEPDTSLRDTEQVPLLEDGGIEAFFKREVLPYVPDAWLDRSKTQIGYEISFTRYFYKPQNLRTLDEITADIRALEAESKGLLERIIKEAE